MRPLRGHAKLARVLVACAVVAGGVVAALILTENGPKSTSENVHVSPGPAPTTGVWAPLTVALPKVPIIAGGIPVDIDPMTTRTDFSTTLFPLGPRRYRMTIFNNSTLGAINAFQWYPPPGVRITKLVSNAGGHCALAGLTGFGGNQFPTLVLYPNIRCDKLDLKAPSCMCLGDGGAMTITFVTDKDIAVGEGEFRLRSATVQFDRIPVSPNPPNPRHITRIATAAVDAGGLTAAERRDAQSALDGLQDSNISLQLTTISARWVQAVPATCRVHLASTSPSTYDVYVFWIPWLAAEPYVWLSMQVTSDPSTSTFQLGAAQPILPGGRLKPNGRTVNRRSVDTTLLSRYGADQVKKNHQLLVAHAGDVFTQPSAPCQVLQNGAIRLLPNS